MFHLLVKRVMVHLSCSNWANMSALGGGFFIFRLFILFLSPFYFLLLEFHWTFSTSCKILPYFVYYYSILIRYSDRPVGLLFLSYPLYFFPYSRLSSYLLRFFILFHCCCSHAQVFVKTLVHEFHISYSHTEWYLLFSDSATESVQWEYGVMWYKYGIRIS